MSKDIQQIYEASPTSGMELTDLLYLGRDPFTVADDFGITFDDFQKSISQIGTLGFLNVTGNVRANNFIPGYSTTATASGTTVLTSASTYMQYFTGILTQTVTMPVTSTLFQGQSWLIVNKSTGDVTVQSSGGNTIIVLEPNTSAVVTCIVASGTTSSSWNALYSPSDLGVLSAQGTENQVLVNGAFGSPVEGDLIFTLPQDIATTSTPEFAAIQLDDGFIYDANGNTVLALDGIASSVNYIQISNNIAGSSPSIVAIGDDTDISISFIPKGVGIALFGTSTAFGNKNAGFIQSAVISGNAGISTAAYGAGFYGTFNAYKSRSTTIGSFVAVQAGDTLGQFTVLGDDGTQFSVAGSMEFVASGTISSGVIPGVWNLYTVNSSGINTLAMTVNSSQQLILANSLTVPYGGTGIGTATAYGLITGGTTATGAFQSVATGTAGQMLQSGGASALPAWTTATFPSAAGATGTILRSNGAGWVATTSTFADTYAASALLYSNGANTVAGLATTNSAALVTDGSGVPAWQALLAGQILVGTTSGAPVATAINSGTNITVANGSGSITVNLSGIVSPVLGGTGVNNGSNTLTLAGTLATSGAFASVFTMTGATNVTFPTSGILATTAGASGIVNSGTQNQLTWYAATGTTVSGLATANNGILVTSAGGVPSIGNGIGADFVFNTVRIGLGPGAVASNTCLGNGALGSVTTGSLLIGIGQNAMNSAGTQTRQVAIGNSSMAAGGGRSVAIGTQAAGLNAAASMTAVGDTAMFYVTSGASNTGVGDSTGTDSASGGARLGTGGFNSFFGFQATTNATDSVGTLALGSNAVADKATGATSADNGPGLAIGSAAQKVGFRGDGTVYPSTTGSGFWRQKINGTYYQTLLFADGSTGLPALTAPSINFGGSTLSNYVANTSWTPTITFASPGDLSVSYASQTGQYTRVGSTIVASFQLTFTPTYTTASSFLNIAGLPVAAGGAGVSVGTVFTSGVGNTWPAGATSLSLQLSASQTFMYLVGSGSGIGAATFATTNFLTGVQTTIYGTITYQV